MTIAKTGSQAGSPPSSSAPLVDAVYSALMTSGVEMTRDPDAADQLHQQVAGIIHDVTAALELEHLSPVESDAPQTLSKTIGRSRARDSVHPSASLEAASLIFDIALPLLLVHLPISASSAEKTVSISRALHRAIMNRVAPAAVGYVETLLEKLALAQHEERLRISRQLHDHVSHNVAAAIQRLMLAQGPEEPPTQEHKGYLVTAEALLRNALAETRMISVELRQIVGDRYIHEAVTSYVDASPILKPLVRVSSTGIPEHLPVSTSEEVYVIIREALRNAATHAHARIVKVRLIWSTGTLIVEVRDDGGGFRPGAGSPTSMGLLTMRERAEAIGARLSIDTHVGQGTSVWLFVDHERGIG